MKAELPYEFQKSFKVLGMVLDERLGCEEHGEEMLRRITARHGVMAQLARISWRLETGILRSTHGALLTSIIRHGLVAIGS